MSKLTDELRQDHHELLSELEAIKGLGLGAAEGRRRLDAVRVRLLAHIRREDAELYPALERAAARDADLERTLRLFARDMAEISSFAVGFFDRLGSGDSAFGAAGDFGRLCALLRTRIRKENEVIYPKYDELQAARQRR